MNYRISAYIILALSSLLVLPAAGEPINEARAKFNYQMFCQGCHTPDASGATEVPQIKGFIGNFLTTTEGREYLVRVPGSANSALDNVQLAEVLNWIILEMGGDSIPQDFTFFTKTEVERLRADALYEVVEYRKKLVLEIMAIRPEK